MQFESTEASESLNRSLYYSSSSSLIASDKAPTDFSTLLSKNEFEEQVYPSARSIPNYEASTYGHHGLHSRSSLSRFSNSNWEEATKQDDELAAASVFRRLSQDGLCSHLSFFRHVFSFYYLCFSFSFVEQILLPFILIVKMSPAAANSFSSSLTSFYPKDLRVQSSHSYTILFCISIYIIYLQSSSSSSSSSPDRLDNNHHIDNLIFYSPASPEAAAPKSTASPLARRFTGIHSSLLPTSSICTLPTASSPNPIPIALSTRYLLYLINSVLEDYLLVQQSTLLSNNYLIKSLTGA